MAISVVAHSAAITIKQKPVASLPHVAGTNKYPFVWPSAYMAFGSVNLIAEGQCDITGLASDDPAGWTLGIIQLQWIMTKWAYYRGQTNVDGDCFLQYARPPAQPAQGCRDTRNPGAIFVDNNPGRDRAIAKRGQPFPLSMKAILNDGPHVGFPLSHLNTLTGSTNFLTEAQAEIHLCTVLSLRNPQPLRGSPPGTYTHLKHFMRNLHWHAQFQPANYANLAVSWTITPVGGPTGNMTNVSRVFEGGPTDPKFTRITTGTAQNCNVLVRNATKAPNTQESRVWTNYDVRH